MHRRSGLALAALLGVGHLAAAAEPSIDYLYIEANEGSSSGGHAALRLGDATFHFQREVPGLLRLSRERSSTFERQYRVLQNRTIHVSRIPVSEETFALVLDRFNRRQQAQTLQLGCLAALRADEDLLAAMLARRRGEGGETRLVGPGFFFDETPDADDGIVGPEEPALVELRAQVERVYGPGFLTQRATALRATLGSLAPDTTPMPPPPVADEPPPPCYGFARRREDVAVSLLGLEALRTARPLLESAVVGATSAPLVLRGSEPEQAAALARALEPRLLELVASSRPGAGYALIVGMARLAALERTRRSGRWVLLDAFPTDAPAIAPDRVARWRGMFAELAGVARDELDQSRAVLASRASADAGMPEPELAGFEAAGSRLHEIEAALDAGRPLRIAPDPMVPARTTRSVALDSDRADDELVRARDVAHARARAYGEAVEHLYRYELVGRNCVTELFRTVDDALGGTADRRLEWVRRLGGAVDLEGALNSVPFVSARTVDAQLDVADTVELPSYRRQRVGELAAREPAFWVHLREASTLTSTIYRRNPNDSAFALFTDDAVAPRPLFGLVNLATGLGAGALGLATLPFDHGETLRAGLRGVLYSLPELVFVSIRKGSFATLPPTAAE